MGQREPSAPLEEGLAGLLKVSSQGHQYLFGENKLIHSYGKILPLLI